MEDERNLELESLVDPPPLPGFDEKPPKAPGRPRWVSLALIAGACALLVGLGIWIGAGIGSSETTQPPESEQLQSPPETIIPSESGWEANLLRADPVPYQSESYWDRRGEAKVYPVFGSGYQRQQITSVTFLDTLVDAPENAWDVTETGDGRVMAWVTSANELYNLYIAAEGGVNAANACSDLFAGYSNAKKINFGEAFHTTGATDMSCMFLGCSTLRELKLDSFDTSAVQDMSGMFYFCESLTNLTLGDSFDTSAVQDMSWMFSVCSSLTNLTLGDSFDTSAVQDMSEMFSYCKALTDLTLGDSFDTSAVQDMSEMFSYCEALTDLTLGENFVTTNANTNDMFYLCPAGADYQHLLN